MNHPRNDSEPATTTEPWSMMTDIASLDREPVRTILVKMLEGHAIVGLRPASVETELDQMAADGLCEHRLAEPHEVPPQMGGAPCWIVKPTFAALVAGVRLACSGELLGVLAVYGIIVRRGEPWHGASWRSVLRELDLRDGGRGDVDDIATWLRARSHHHILELPRRDGLDPQGASHA